MRRRFLFFLDWVAALSVCAVGMMISAITRCTTTGDITDVVTLQ